MLAGVIAGAQPPIWPSPGVAARQTETTYVASRPERLVERRPIAFPT